MSSHSQFDSFKTAFKGVRAVLVEHIDVSNGLLDELRERRVLTGRHVDNVLLKATEFDRAEKLLDILERRPDELLLPFKDALIATDQRYIWDKYLSSARAIVPIRVNVTSSSAATSPLPSNFDEEFSTKLETVVKLLRQNLHAAEINSLRAKLGVPDLDEFDRESLLVELDDKIEEAFRKGIDVDTSVMRRLKLAFRFMIVYGTELVLAHPSHSIVIYLLCPSVESVENVKKMVDSGMLRKLLEAAVKEHLGSPIDIAVEIRLNPDDYRSALACFDSQPGSSFTTTASAEEVQQNTSADVTATETEIVADVEDESKIAIETRKLNLKQRLAQLLYSRSSYLVVTCKTDDSAPLSNIGQLPVELLEMVLMRSYIQLIVLDCSFLRCDDEHVLSMPPVDAEQQYANLIAGIPFILPALLHGPTTPYYNPLNLQLSKASTPEQPRPIQSHVPIAYRRLAAVCYSWWRTMRGWPQSTTRHWFKHQLRGLLTRSAIMQFNAVEEKLSSMLEPQYGKTLENRLLRYDCTTMDTKYFETVTKIDTIFGSVLKREREYRELLFELEQSDQQHVANYIRHKGVRSEECGDVWPLDKTQSTLLKSDRHLPENIGSSDDFLHRLLAAGCIRPDECNKLKSITDTLQRAKELLGILSRCSIATYKRFTVCLADEGRHDALRLLRGASAEWFEEPLFLSTVKKLVASFDEQQRLHESTEHEFRQLVPVLKTALRIMGTCQDLLQCDCGSLFRDDPVMVVTGSPQKSRLMFDVLAVMTAEEKADLRAIQIQNNPGFVKLCKSKPDQPGFIEEQVPEESARILFKSLEKGVDNTDELKGRTMLHLSSWANVNLEVYDSAPSETNQDQSIQYSIKFVPCHQVDSRKYAATRLPDGTVTWRQCFPAEVTAIWNQVEPDKGCHRLVLQIMKIIRNAVFELREISIYHLENAAFFVFHEKQSAQFWQSDRIGVRIIDVLKKLEEFLGCGFMPDYFLPEVNLFHHLPSSTIKNAYSFVHQLTTSENKLIKLMENCREMHVE